jgi:hypothetical protein
MTTALLLALSSGAAAWLPQALHTSTPVVLSSPRCPAAFCSESLPDAASAAIPPERLADAWRREENAAELSEMLKGCSIFLVGFGQRKTAVGRVISRRLKKYRFYDIGSLMCSTYTAISGPDGDSAGLPQMVANEPLENVEQLSNAILNEVQQFSRSVFVTWDGAVSSKDFMVMQQGIVVHLDFGEGGGDAALPAEDTEAVAERWREGHAKADVTVSLDDSTAADDAAAVVIDAVSSFIKANPAKSKEWKETADERLEAGGTKLEGPDGMPRLGL